MDSRLSSFTLESSARIGLLMIILKFEHPSHNLIKLEWGIRIASETGVAFLKLMDITYKLTKRAVLHEYSHTLIIPPPQST